MKKKILKSKISITNLVNLNADVLNYLKKKVSIFVFLRFTAV